MNTERLGFQSASGEVGSSQKVCLRQILGIDIIDRSRQTFSASFTVPR